ncbi:hypothetical protein SAMN05660971_03688 [Halomonas cupida]|uniref:Uncharacterized protein n=1 Tax=Halomonas cupida TaxID=44933 RepID=A0A1M7L0S9_9GAMM|nr:hypothetical protein SAMN05660971_03688 [Halomonas cupida]
MIYVEVIGVDESPVPDQRQCQSLIWFLLLIASHGPCAASDTRGGLFLCPSQISMESAYGIEP